MLHEFGLGDEFLALLYRGDQLLAEAVAAAGCPHCGGPLHQANYPRKPRGGRLFEALGAFTLRRSMCCGHCRRRSLPPSLLFLGRRVYIESVVLLASFGWGATQGFEAMAVVLGIPSVTLRRWAAWWREVPTLPMWPSLRARFAPPPPDERALPASLLLRLSNDVGGPAAAVMFLAAKSLAPLTTTLRCAAGFVRVIATQLSAKELTQDLSIAGHPSISYESPRH